MARMGVSRIYTAVNWTRRSPDTVGTGDDWIDLSTGINPRAWPVPELPLEYWINLPNMNDSDRLIEAARQRWKLPRQSDVVLAPGVSSLIAMLPFIRQPGTVTIRQPTHGQFAFTFAIASWTCCKNGGVQVSFTRTTPTGN